MIVYFQANQVLVFCFAFCPIGAFLESVTRWVVGRPAGQEGGGRGAGHLLSRQLRDLGFPGPWANTCFRGLGTGKPKSGAGA